ncbi:MAG: LysE family transporter [Rhizobiaceae bacterium]|nr:LysE family transporter [Rhizobiaceae bacterium]
MNFDIWLLYVATLLAFMLTPGPSHLLMLSNSIRHGFRPSLATAAGDLMANALQMFAAGIGLAAILISTQNALTVIKWVGAAYLFWMGVQMWRKSRHHNKSDSVKQKISLRALWMQGFFTSLANPKAVVFFAALFPQFISAQQPFGLQFLILSLTYIAVDGAFLSTYGATAGWFAKRLKGNSQMFVDRVGGTFLIGAALLLSFKTLRQTG